MDADGYINRRYSTGGTALTNKAGGIKLNKQNFVFNHLKEAAKIKDYYQIGHVLGAGAYGEVRSCTHIKT